MRRSTVCATVRAIAALLLCFGLTGCIFVSSHSAYQRIHDNQLTYNDYNGTMDFDPVGDSFPPMPVHEFDHDRVEKGGGYRAIDGWEWFEADDVERGDLLEEVQAQMPRGSVIVIEVATGEVWVIPPDANQVVLDGAIAAWTEDEYDDLPEYVAEEVGFGFYGPTLYGYQQLTAVAAHEALRPVVYVHPLAPSAISGLAARNALSFAMTPYWQYLTPTQRMRLLLNLRNYLVMTTLFRTNPFLFGVSIPNGRIYAFQEMALWQLATVYAARVWTQQQILLLSTTGILPALAAIRRGEILRRALQLED